MASSDIGGAGRWGRDPAIKLFSRAASMDGCVLRKKETWLRRNIDGQEIRSVVLRWGDECASRIMVLYLDAKMQKRHRKDARWFAMFLIPVDCCSMSHREIIYCCCLSEMAQA